MPPATEPARSVSRPLIIRPGARFACFSDGLCCTDIHALGPLGRSEAKAMRKLVPNSIYRHETIEAPCMKTGANGACAQRDGGLCGVQKRFGAEAKPNGCRRFPYGLVSTPEGGRVTTEHRCPCRTLGDRPEVDLKDADASLRDNGGRLEANQIAPVRVPIAAERFVSFARYRAAEQKLLARLQAGERAEEVLGAAPLPELTRSSWPELAVGFYEMTDASAGGTALGWWGDALMHLCVGVSGAHRARPWAWSFEKAISRSPRREDPEKILNDWIADELWMMRWLEWDCTFDVARAELATRLAAVRHIIDLIMRAGVRSDQAAAEAVMIAELGACNDHWTEVVDTIANFPSPAVALE